MNIRWSDESRRSLRAIRRFIAMDSEFYAARMVKRQLEPVSAAAGGRKLAGIFSAHVFRIFP